MVDPGRLQIALDSFVKNDPGNNIPGGGKIYSSPLIGYVSADDSLFDSFCSEDIIGSMFRPPRSWLPEAVTVISHFLPFSESIRRSNYDGLLPSVKWMHGRFIGEVFNEKLRRFLAGEIEAMGGKVVVPALHDDYCADYELFTSNWSERHIAYAAGLGS